MSADKQHNEDDSEAGTQDLADVKLVSYRRGGLGISTIVSLYFLVYYVYQSASAQYIHSQVRLKYFNSSSNSSKDDFCTRDLNNTNTVLEIKVQAETSEKIVEYSYAMSIPAILMNLVLGSYSDHIGRKIFILIPLLGAFAKGVVSLIVVTWKLDLDYFYLANGLQGVTGSTTTLLLACFAYMADITPPEGERTLAMTLVEVASSLASMVGNLGVGLLIGMTGYFYPMIINAGVLLIIVLFVLCALKETQHRQQGSNLSLLVHLKQVLRFFNPRTKGCLYLTMLCIFCFGGMARAGRDNIDILYTLDRPFCWSPEKIGYFGAVRIFSYASGSALCIYFLHKCVSDVNLISMSMTSLIVCLVLEGLAKTDAMIWCAAAIGAVEMVYAPVARGVLSRMTSSQDQGAMFAAVATVETVYAFLSVLQYNYIYNVTVGLFKGAVFLAMTFWSALTILLACWFRYLFKRRASMLDQEHIQH